MQLTSIFKNIFLFAMIFVIVMLINQPFISFNMIYQEQASIYLANQTITNWHDLLNIYLHPAWLNVNIPFFRPSGHFLIYQLLMPIVGWHNIFALNIISFTFLAIAGFFFIKLYQLLFPSFTVGAFIALSIYLMHPALSVSRLTFMHFDFAYVCFLVISLYLFVLFCTQNKNHWRYFISSLIFYALAITFKEPAIMLGPVLFCFYCINFYKGQSLSNYAKELLLDKTSLFILITITVTSAILAFYLFLSWPSLTYAGNSFNLEHSLSTANNMLKDIFGFQKDLISSRVLPFQDYAWRTIIFTPAARYILWLFFWLSLVGSYFVIRDKASFAYKKALLFLLLSAILFTLLPLSWASGAPWHHSLTLICLSMIMGFYAEYLLRLCKLTSNYVASCCIIIASCITYTSIAVNFENIIKYIREPKGFLGITLNRNAILAPPAIKQQLNNDSILVVEDSTILNDYFLGNSAYPLLLFFTDKDYEHFQQRQANFFLKFQSVYSGNLFRYAYLMPGLKEELYPFIIEKMDDIPNEILYNWLKHYNNIFCVGYDSAGNWHDKTQLFKASLAKQQAKRMLAIHTYHAKTMASIPQTSDIKKLPIDDKQLCEFYCDQNSVCKSFIYKHQQCYFYKKL